MHMNSLSHTDTYFYSDTDTHTHTHKNPHKETNTYTHKHTHTQANTHALVGKAMKYRCQGIKKLNIKLEKLLYKYLSPTSWKIDCLID